MCYEVTHFQRNTQTSKENIGDEDWQHSVKVGFGEVRVGAPVNTDDGRGKYLLDMQALVGGKWRRLHLEFLCDGDVVEPGGCL